ncbi:hypothetical protein BHE74_00033450 [Ensete ventricosum]|nr:hypothetical protein BHE74_00033450 [Ensete ventricosum]
MARTVTHRARGTKHHNELSRFLKGVEAPTDALAAMRSSFDVDLTMTIRRLVEVRKNYFVSMEYELHAPLPGEHPYNAFPSDFSLSTNALEVGLRFSLHLMIEVCLERWQISPS